MSDAVLLEVTDGAAPITLNRADRMFALMRTQSEAPRHQGVRDLPLDKKPPRRHGPPSAALVWRASYALQSRLPNAAHAKAHLADRSPRLPGHAHGGVGYAWECDLMIWFRRPPFNRAHMGSPSLRGESVAEMAGW